MEQPIIFFVGKPGSGKGTQAKLLSEATGWTPFSAGDLFREIRQEDTVLGRKVKEEYDAGILQPHWFAMYLFLKVLFSLPSDAGVIFDGFSRKVPEAELIIDSLQWLGRSFTILDIKVSDEEVKRRIARRKDIEGRADDNAFDKRLDEYKKFTEPAIDLFRKAGVLVEVNGEQTPEAIAADVKTALNLSPLRV